MKGNQTGSGNTFPENEDEEEEDDDDDDDDDYNDQTD